MKLFNYLTKPLIYGTWLLRTTNDYTIKDKINYLIIQDDKSIKFKSLNYSNLFGIKKSRNAIIDKINELDNNTYIVNLKYNCKNTYSNVNDIVIYKYVFIT